MIPIITAVVALSALVLLNRRGTIGDDGFSVAVVIILSGLAGYYGVSQY